MLHEKLRNNRQHAKTAINTSAKIYLTSDSSHRQYLTYHKITKITQHEKQQESIQQQGTQKTQRMPRYEISKTN